MNDYRSVASEILDVRSDDGRELSCSCPFHSDKRPSFRINAKNGLWICHSCHEAGNIKWLYKNLTGETMPDEESLDWASILDQMNRKEPEPVYESFHDACSDLADAYQGHGKHLRVWGDERGITDERLISKFGLGYDVLENALTMPTEYGLVRRYLDKKHKYRFPAGMPKAQMLYGAEYVRGPVATVCEGQIDALACWQAGVHAVSIFGSSISSKQVDMLKSMDLQFLVLFLDDDEQGWEGCEKIRKKVGKHLAVFEVDYEGYEGLDPGSIPPSSISNLVSSAIGSIR